MDALKAVQKEAAMLVSLQTNNTASLNLLQPTPFTPEATRCQGADWFNQAQTIPCSAIAGFVFYKKKESVQIRCAGCRHS